MQSEAVRLYRSIERKTKLLHEERLRLGKLLLKIRAQLNPGGRGKKGTFIMWLEDSGINVSAAYNYISLAKNGVWQPSKWTSRKRIVFWQQWNARVKRAADNVERVDLLKKAIAYLQKTYSIKASVTVSALK